jgi:His-Xaa-Ser system radical SAM maturase HxsB
MAISHFAKDNKERIIQNNFRVCEIDKDKILVVTDYGSWVVLSKEEFETIKSEKIKDNKELFNIVKESGIILTKGTFNNVIENYRERCNFLFQGPSLHIVVPTSRCNQNCTYCHAMAKAENAKDTDMDEVTADKTLDFIFHSPSKNIKIEFQGGEPLLNFEIVKYIISKAKLLNKKYCKKLDFALSTNLTLMNDEILDFLIEHEVSITTSLDGPKELHDKNRPSGSGSSYEETVKWIRKIKENYQIDAMPVITKNSLPFWKEIVDEYVELDSDFVWIKPIHKVGTAVKNWENVGYNAKDFLDFWKKSLDYIMELNKEGKKIKEIFTTILLKKILKKESLNFCCLQSPCGAAIGQLAYDEKGDIYVCDEARQEEMFKLGNVKEDCFNEIMKSKKAVDIISSSINDSLMCDACTWKPYCGVCPVSTYTEQGNIIPKLALSNRCKIYKGALEQVFRKILSDEETKNLFFKWIETPDIT